jgi:hypothetical protein
MLKKLLCLFLLSPFVYSLEYINYGQFEDDKSIFTQKDITALSQKFLDTKYIANTLKNSEINTAKENLIINFEALDCFTFIDTIRALKYSQNKKEFKYNLIHTRYKDGNISYQNRNHFFSDWKYYNGVLDITCTVGPCEKNNKILNENEKYLKEIAPVKREISYIAPHKIDFSKVRSGDYVGIYSQKKDLDVTHTGLLIKTKNKILIRHASSLEKKIIDSDFFEYTKNKKGILLFRDFLKHNW